MFPGRCVADQPVLRRRPPDAQPPRARSRVHKIIYRQCCAASKPSPEPTTTTSWGTRWSPAANNFAHQLRRGRHRLRNQANRLAVGPTSECKPIASTRSSSQLLAQRGSGQIVYNLADTGCAQSALQRLPRPIHARESPIGATRAYYPDDPSNATTAISGTTWFRILHAGRTSTTCTISTPTSGCVHRTALPANTWIARRSGPAFTLETVFNGGGNKNLTVGDLDLPPSLLPTTPRRRHVGVMARPRRV